jgi:hypothetical protein
MAASMPALEEWVRPGDVAWWWSLLAVGMGRTADMFSTWIGTPGLRNEGNPFARWLGWRKGILLNVLVVPLAACWPMIAVSLATTSAMVAARNLHTVWLMRMMGEDAYRDWFGGWMHATPRLLFLGCHWGEALLTGGLGLALVVLGPLHVLSFGIGVGFCAYGFAVAVFTTLAYFRR